ncbi:helix-hairpin-helix domain-containing protein [Parabacteroides sp. OttesenSCG-928-N08]|nr:helix-hairpin-helix domain-containing protein [Parabacteroides sp. OttesenSCG-928-N08]
MRWQDFLYFSKGERRALLLLVSLIAVGWLLLVVKDLYVEPEPPALVATDSLSVAAPDSQAISPPAAPEARTFRKPPPLIKEEKPARDPRRPYAGATKSEKFAIGTVVELNNADTTTLKRIPGIGSTFSRRIVGYRRLLGGFYSVEQLREVYGIDEERFEALKGWFRVDTAAVEKLYVNRVTHQDSLSRHPYINYRQARILLQLRRQQGELTGWENLLLLEEFNEADRRRIRPYLSFD